MFFKDFSINKNEKKAIVECDIGSVNGDVTVVAKEDVSVCCAYVESKVNESDEVEYLLHGRVMTKNEGTMFPYVLKKDEKLFLVCDVGSFKVDVKGQYED